VTQALFIFTTSIQPLNGEKKIESDPSSHEAGMKEKTA